VDFAWDKILNVASLLVLIFQGVLTWGLWSLRKQFVSHKDCEGRCRESDDRAGKADARMAQMEAKQAAMPTASDVGYIKDRTAAIEGELKALAATMDGLSKILTRIERPLDLLMEHHVRERK